MVEKLLLHWLLIMEISLHLVLYLTHFFFTTFQLLDNLINKYFFFFPTKTSQCFYDIVYFGRPPTPVPVRNGFHESSVVVNRSPDVLSIDSGNSPQRLVKYITDQTFLIKIKTGFLPTKNVSYKKIHQKHDSVILHFLLIFFCAFAKM